MHDIENMNGREFIKKIKKLGRKNGIEVAFNEDKGKGSHGTLYYGDEFTTVKRSEIGPGLLNSMLNDLGLTKKDIGQ